MPRSSRYGPGRGSHVGKGVLSGSTIGTILSGVTLTPQGLQVSPTKTLTPTELAYLNGAVTNVLAYGRTGAIIETGIIDALGRANVGLGDPSSTLSIRFSNITTGLILHTTVKADATAGRVHWTSWTWSVPDTAGVSIYCTTVTGGLAQCIAGSSVAYIAVGL